MLKAHSWHWAIPIQDAVLYEPQNVGIGRAEISADVAHTEDGGIKAFYLLIDPTVE